MGLLTDDESKALREIANHEVTVRHYRKPEAQDYIKDVIDAYASWPVGYDPQHDEFWVLPEANGWHMWPLVYDFHMFKALRTMVDK